MYKSPVLKNIRWQCISCNHLIPDAEFEQLPRDEKGYVRVCPACGQNLGYAICAELVQQRIGTEVADK